MSKNINQLNRLSTFASHHNDPRPRFLLSNFRLSTFGLLLPFILLISSCGLDVEDPTPPSAPVWVQKSLPEEWPERGIDAHESGGIFLEWEPNPQDNNAVYLLYRAQYFEIQDSLGHYDLIATVENKAIERHQFLDESVQVRVQYYYKLKAEDQSDNQSALSDSLFYTLLPQISNDGMKPNGVVDTLSNDRELSWNYRYNVEMEDYGLTLIDIDGSLIHRVRLTPKDYIAGRESYLIPDSIQLIHRSLYRWRVDTGAEYVEGRERMGSESSWGTFLYVDD
jgi:hypothetical protein